MWGEEGRNEGRRGGGRERVREEKREERGSIYISESHELLLITVPKTGQGLSEMLAQPT